MKRIVCVIPARLASTRFPRKIFAKIGSKTLLELVWERASGCSRFDDVYFAIDSKEAAEEIDRFGGKYHMTSPECPTGTNRLIEFVQTSGVKADVWVNWQGDEPFIPKEMIDDLLQGIDREGELWTLKKEITREEALSTHTPKVVTDRFGKALYFSRSVIPFDRDQTQPTLYKHVGLYAYSKQALEKIAAMEVSFLAKTEMLEQLTFLENGLSMYVYPTVHESIDINTPEDLARCYQFESRFANAIPLC